MGHEEGRLSWQTGCEEGNLTWNKGAERRVGGRCDYGGMIRDGMRLFGDGGKGLLETGRGK